VTAAQRATNALHEDGHAFDPALRKHLSPLGWEHINLTGDYQWRNTAKLGKSKFKASASVLAYDLVRFLKGPLIAEPQRDSN
jgi:hypothetical protein